jgi:hypothetical protein
MTPATHFYLIRKACGCAIASIADIPECRKWTAADLARYVRQGYAVERMPLEDWEAPTGCACPRPAPAVARAGGGVLTLELDFTDAPAERSAR